MVKKIIFLFLGIASINLFAQVPNGGFESWVAVGSYSNPVGWSTMNNTTATYSMFTATPASPGNPGTAYMKLTSKMIANRVVNGIAVSGRLDSLTLQPISGYTYTQRPANFTGRYQHMIFGSSQGSLKVLTTRWNATAVKRDTIAYGIEVLSGMAMSWSNFNISLNYMDSLNYPDTCVITLQASGANPTNNDYLWVDNLALTGTVAVVTLPPPITTGLAQQAEYLTNFKAYPNPVENSLQISGSVLTGGLVEIRVYDASGKNVLAYSENAAAGLFSKTLDLGDLPSGLYLVKVSNGDKGFRTTIAVN